MAKNKGLSKWFKSWGEVTKKGSKYKTADGQVKQYSDFQRGVAAGRMAQKSEDIEYSMKHGKEYFDN